MNEQTAMRTHHKKYSNEIGKNYGNNLPNNEVCLNWPEQFLNSTHFILP